MNIHQQLGEYSNAVSAFDIAVANLHRAHGELTAKAAALPVPVFDGELAERLAAIIPATTLGLAAHYTKVVVPKTKGREIPNE